jgi:hypothetical protein
VRRFCMRSILTTILAALVPLLVMAAADDEAQTAGEAWLSLLDSQKYEESWKQASSMFQSQVTQEQWTSALKKSRDPLGQLVSRSKSRADFLKTLRGAPDGDYAVFHFETAFQNREGVTERLTLVLEDGKWRAAAYAIH